MKRADENIEDVYDGAVYQRKYNLSLKLNTDGVAIFHSLQFGVWPLFLLVNELPLSSRHDPSELFMHISMSSLKGGGGGRPGIVWGF